MDGIVVDYLRTSRAGEAHSARMEWAGAGRAVTPGVPGRATAPVYAPGAMESVSPTPEDDR